VLLGTLKRYHYHWCDTQLPSIYHLKTEMLTYFYTIGLLIKDT